MRQVAFVLALLGTMLLAGTATAGLSVGVNDDAGKDPAFTSWFFPAMSSVGLQNDTITLRWDETAPTAIPNQPEIGAAVAKAKAAGIAIVFDLYPLHSTAFTFGSRCVPSSDPEGCGDAGRIQEFAAWTAKVSRSFPNVHQFVVMNECNQPLFVNPQWDAAGANTSAQVCGRALAAAYDALKAVNQSTFVWGIGSSPRGNDNPNAASNSSTRPVTFIRALGAWFRAFVTKTHRTIPLMDGLDFHPYPIPQSQPFAQGYPNANEASVANLARLYQAFYDGFAGTPQPTIGQQAGGGLPVSLNETGIQTDTTGHAGYVGSEVSATSAGGVIGQFATEDYQASWYRQMLDLLACDPNVRVVNIFHLVDEPNLPGWQSGLYFVDGAAKQSAQVVEDWIAQTGGRCLGATVPWMPPGIGPGPPGPTNLGPPVSTAPAKICAGTLCAKAARVCYGGVTKAGCGAFLAAASRQRDSLQKRYAAAAGTTKAALKQQLVAAQQAIALGNAGLAKLTR